MGTPTNSSDPKTKYAEILVANGISDEVSEVTVQDAGVAGEGTASENQYVTVKFANPDIKPLHLFVKNHQTNTPQSELILDMKAFEKEARFLTKYVPAAVEFCKSKGKEGLLDFIPKCYYGDEKTIVLENLVIAKGYELLKKEELQDLEAATLAVEALAKYHAVSYAMIMDQGGPDKFFELFPNLNFESLTSPMSQAAVEPVVENGIDTVMKILEKSNVENRDEKFAILKSYIGKSYGLVLNTLKYSGEKNELLVLNHGDYWNNNMMFLRDKYSNKFTGFMAIDFQVVRYNSPMIDFGYYLYTSVKPSVRQSQLHDLLKMYLDTFKEITNALGFPISVTQEELYQIYRQKFEYGFWFGLTVVCGPALVVLKQMDMNEIGDLNNWSIMFDKLIQKWIAENPKQGNEISKEIVKLIAEFEKIKG